MCTCEPERGFVCATHVREHGSRYLAVLSERPKRLIRYPKPNRLGLAARKAR